MTHTAVNGSTVSDRLEIPEEYVGYTVYDPQRRKIGRVKELFVNGHDEPEYIRVKMGLFGLKSALIPVQIVAVNRDKRCLTLH